MFEKVKNNLKKWGLFAIKWRYLIALVIFIFCVVFKLHGSSISVYNKMFENTSEYNSEENILGNGRDIRSDEWVVHTPYYMSQTYNNFEKDSYMMSLEGQDMIVGYNAPVLDITILGKPFTWGYVLLGNEYGLSWYWCMKLILLVLVCFELCMIVTRKNKAISVLGAFLIAFSPLVQWWFVPHIVDVLFWGMAILVLAYHFFTQEKWKRTLCMILLPLSAVTFALALFPSLQVPIAFVDVALLVAFLIRDKNEITFKKKDIWRIVIMVGYVIGVLSYTLITSKDAILALLHTSYPGSRVSLGGDNTLRALFTDPVTFTLPFKDIIYLNNCEVSNFIHFAPLLMILHPFIYKKMKKDKNMVVGNVLLGCLAVMAVFMCIGFPKILARITLLSYSNRMDIVYGLMATIFTVWGISMIWKKKILTKKQIILSILIYVFLYGCLFERRDLDYLGIKWAVIIAGLTAILGYLMLTRRKKLFISGMMVVIVLSGMTVNPLSRGISALTAHPLEQKIREISEGDREAYWVGVNNFRFSSLGIVNGARMLNAVNFYPDFEKWELIDENREYEEIYNRYAHIRTTLTAGETEFLPGSTADKFDLKINEEDLLKWPVKYLVIEGEPESGLKSFEKIYDDSEGDYHIYQRV